MSDFKKCPIVVDSEEEVEFLSKKVGCTVEEADLYLETLMNYYKTIGLIGEHTEGQPIRPQDDARPVIDAEEEWDYISKTSGLPKELVAKPDIADYEFTKIFEQLTELKNKLLDLSIEVESFRNGDA